MLEQLTTQHIIGQRLEEFFRVLNARRRVPPSQVYKKLDWMLKYSMNLVSVGIFLN